MKKKQIYRKSDCLRLEAIRDGSKSGRSMSQNGYQRGNFLQLEKKIRRLGHNGTSPLAPAGRREQPTQKAGSGPKFR